VKSQSSEEAVADEDEVSDIDLACSTFLPPLGPLPPRAALGPFDSLVSLVSFASEEEGAIVISPTVTGTPANGVVLVPMDFTDWVDEGDL
jgi:hypothetical protein